MSMMFTPRQPSGGAAGPLTDAKAVAVAAVFASLPSGTASTDIANLQAAINDLPAAGGLIQLARGDYNLSAVSALTASKPVRFLGHGRGGLTAEAATRWINTTQNGVPLTVEAHGCGFEEFAIVNLANGTPTSGQGILFNKGDGARMTRMKMLGFFNQVEFIQGRYQQFTDNYFFDSQNYGLFLKNTDPLQGDFGDQSCFGNTFCSLTTSRIAQAAVRWESGGGLKFVGNKTNGNYNTLGQSQIVGLDAAVADGVDTSVLTVVANSFEGIEAGAGGVGVLVRQSGTGTGYYSKVTIGHNEFLAGTAIEVRGTTPDRINQVLIGNNVFSGNNPGISASNCASLTIGKNSHKLPLGNALVKIGTGVREYSVEVQDVDTTSNIAWLWDDTAGTNVHRGTGTGGTYRREIPSTLSDVTFTPLMQVQMPEYSSAVVEYKVTGQVSGVGAFVCVARRTIVQGAAGTAPTVATVGTDTNTANAPTLQFDASAAQTLTFRIRRASGSGTDVFGQAAMTVEGAPSRVWKL
jgi:hypothetical protein